MNECRDEASIRMLCDVIRQTAYQIHLYFGTGFLEKVFENTLKHRLENTGLDVKAQVDMVVHDEDGYVVGHYTSDLIVEGKIIVELKVVKTLNAAHEAQLMNYLKTTGIQDGMLINFGSEKFECIKRVNSSSPYQPHFVVDGNSCGADGIVPAAADAENAKSAKIHKDESGTLRSSADSASFASAPAGRTAAGAVPAAADAENAKGAKARKDGEGASCASASKDGNEALRTSADSASFASAPAGRTADEAVPAAADAENAKDVKVRREN